MGLNTPPLTLRQHLQLLRGKVRRFYLGVFRRRYVRQNHARRHGECARCGACCIMGFHCLTLRRNGHGTECAIHNHRPMNCRLFPIDERDLADRDLILPHVPCGYHFDGDDQSPPKP
ncbi:MAG: hypothetical protein ACOC8D_02985 [bacterium]